MIKIRSALRFSMFSSVASFAVLCAAGQCPTAANAAAPVDYDKQLTAQLLIIEKSDAWHEQDKISAACERVKTMLSKWSNQPALMAAPLTRAKAAGLDVLESKDHALRIYNWFTHNGGTMQINDNVIQYKAAGACFGKIKLGDQLDDDVNYTGIEAVRTTSGETVYLLFSEMIGSNIDYSTAVRAVAVRGKDLPDVKFFKTKKSVLSTIACDTNRDTTKDINGDLVGIYYDKATRTIKVPLVNKDMTFDDKYLCYKFDGQKFSYAGVGE